MSQSGEINLNKIKGIYSVEDIRFVDGREIDYANEFRLTYEISSGVGLTLLGVLVTNFSWLLLLTTVAFLLFGVINVFRYDSKYKKIKKSFQLTEEKKI